ncbi:GTP 3',8-cyclase MoaA [Rhizobium sp. 16-488-2a]|nr:GTP 3',8-cyclase MoaA [Rhizobium sp. 16-488-2b]MBO9178559.1 GTP 3',8-cyclase MoaA [Rhizobium sp. 16-488-2a]
MIDGYGRRVNYLRVSVTDRCDFRCTYCMSESMTFLPREELLTLAELERLCELFISKGVRKLRLTGGEPLVRKGVMNLVQALGRRIGSGLDELTLTTNGSQLAEYSRQLVDAGVRRINVSLDSLNADRFRKITRRGDLPKVLDGISGALGAGLTVKLNVVAMRGVNDHEIPDLVRFAHNNGMDVTLIETMPMGDVGDDRTNVYLPLSELRRDLADHFTMKPLGFQTSGPARYVEVAETGGKLGFITPMSHNFCESCNRVRLTCTGTLYMCLGQDDAVDLRAELRAGADDDELGRVIDHAIARKPRGHDFVIGRGEKPAVRRHMSVTGG